MKRRVVSIGGMAVAVDREGKTFRFEESYRPFQDSSLRPAAVWRIRPGSIPGPFLRLPGRCRWTLAVRKRRALFLLRRGKIRPVPWKAAALSANGNRGEIWIDRGKDGGGLPPLFFLDLLLFAYCLSRKRGAIVHAAAVKRGEDAYLFPGPEGCGKSTWSDLAAAVPGCEVLGEDKVILRRDGGNFRVYGSPWNPRPGFRSPGQGRLRGIYCLSPAAANRLRPLSPAEARLRLLSSLFLPFAASAELLAASSLAAALIAAVPVYSFSFRNDESATRFFFRPQT
jgi:hypothetical protein